ncbi:MAG: chemotaxis protein CheX [Planctomycetota bacterium]
MQIEYINPVVEATMSTLKTLVDLDVFQKKASANTSFQLNETNSFVAVIGMAGAVQGSVVLSFSYKIAREIVGKMIMSEPENDEEIADGVGEIVNIIAGNAKTILSEQNLGLNLSIPNVIQGSDIQVHPPEGVPAIMLPFECELGQFQLQLAFTQPKVKA